MSRASNMGARVGTFVLALLFLFIAVASSAVVIWQIHEENKKQASTAAPAATPAKQEGKLEGTKLEGFTPVTEPVTALQVTDTKVGTGDEVKASDTVTVDYTGALASTGVIFQSSLDSGQPVSFPLSGVIPGWTQGVPGMKVGGTRRLLIPAALAYGATPPSGSGIPANADLVFDITLHKIGQ